MHHFFDTYPVSRSQARRLSQRFESFKEVILDFKDVEEIGQGFAHELFSKYVREHPNIQLIPQNTNMEIDKMLRHVGFSGNGGSKL